MSTPGCPRLAGRILLALLVSASALSAQPTDGVVVANKISQLEGGLGGVLDNSDEFGSAVAVLGDVDGNGTTDIAVGSPKDDDGATQAGAVYVLLRKADGTLLAQQKISALEGGLGAVLAAGDRFGSSVSALGDVDGDGIPDLAVGAPLDDHGGLDTGVVWILMLNADGTVREQTRIGADLGGFTGSLDGNDRFGAALADLGDLDGDGTPDLAVGAPRDDDGAPQSGAVWVLFLAGDGAVASHAKISATTEGAPIPIAFSDDFGSSLARIGDLDFDGRDELAIGTPGTLDGEGLESGAVWVTFLTAEGGVSAATRIGHGSGGLVGPVPAESGFGQAVGALGDLDDDGLRDLAIGAPLATLDGTGAGAIWLLALDVDGSVRSELLVGPNAGGFGVGLDDGDGFGSSLASLGIAANAQVSNLLVGAPLDDDGGSNAGAIWQLSLALPEGDSPFVDFASGADGRAGRPDLLLPPAAGPGDDFIGEPVVVVPNTEQSYMWTENVPLEYSFGGELDSADGADGGFGGGGGGGGGFGSGLGGGTFQETFETGEEPAQVAQGDLNGDGFGDVVTANRGEDSFSVLLQQDPGVGPPGPESFAEKVDYALPIDASPRSIAVGDLDGNGDLDVFVAGDGGVSTFLNDGTGVFAFAGFTPVVLLTDLALGDVNGDGHLDVVAASGGVAAGGDLGGGPAAEAGFATVLIGDGTGSLATGQVFASGRAVASVELGELDDTAGLDALLAIHEFDGGPSGEPQGRVELYVGNGGGGFAPSATFAGLVDPDPDGIHPIYGRLADINGDGLLDAVYVRNENIAFAPGTFAEEHPPLALDVLLNDGAGGFTIGEIATAYVGKGVAPLLADVVDVDRLGAVDLVVVWFDDTTAGIPAAAEAFVSRFAVLVGLGDGTFIDPAPNQFLTGDEPGDPDVGHVDSLFDGGGLDLLVPSLADNSVTALLGDGAGGVLSSVTTPDIDALDPGTLNPGGVWQGGPRVLVAGDLDGDGLDDAVVYNAWKDLSGFFAPVPSLSILSSDGTGLLPRVQYLPLVFEADVGLGDIDGDGLLDVVATQRAQGLGTEEVYVFLGLGDGTVVPTPLVIGVPNGRRLTGGLAVIDVDGDEAVDIVSSVTAPDTGAGEVFVVVHVGAELLARSFDIGASWQSIRSLDLGDLNNDGPLDVALGENDGRLFLGEGVGNGRFVPLATSSAAAAVGGGALRIADLDGSDDLDLVSTNGAETGLLDQAFVRTLAGLGGGLFAVGSIPGLGAAGSGGALRPLVADLDEDGASDLVLVHGTTGSLSIVLNGLNTFEPLGTGLPGSGGVVPQLEGLGFTNLGGTVTFSIEGGLGGAPFVLFLGLGVLDHPIYAVEQVLIELPLVLGGEPGVPGAGFFSLPAQIPDKEKYIGLELVLQAFVVDPEATLPGPTGLAPTNGLKFRILP